MGTALRNPGQIIGLPCISASVADGAVLVLASGTDDTVQLPGSVPVVSGVIGLAKGVTTAAASSSAPQAMDVVLNGIYAGNAGAAITRGQAVVVNSTAGDLRPYNALLDEALQIVGTALESVSSGDKVALNILPNFGSGAAEPPQEGFYARVVATSNQALATALAAGQTLNGVTLAAGDRVLLVGQSTPAQNGLYLVPASGAASFAPEWSQGQVRVGSVVQVGGEGSGAGSFPNSEWKACATQVSAGGIITVGTTDPLFYPRAHVAQVTLSGGAGTASNLYILSASATTGSGSAISALDTTAAAAVKLGTVTAGRGNGSVAVTGTTTDVIQVSVINW